MTVEFRLLGAIEASIDGQLADVGHARQQCVLVALLIEANHPVSTDQLIEYAWGADLPRQTRTTLYSYVSRLRRALEPTRDVGIDRCSGGYRLRIDENAVDVHRFHRLVEHARATDDDERAADRFGTALRLWRGEAFSGLDNPWVNGVRHALGEDRLAAELDHTDRELRLGRHTTLLADLSARADARPLDERLAGQLMLALYRCGRQADALRRYDQTRLRLAEELGADPSPALRDLHQRVLRGDPAVAGAAGSPALSPVLTGQAATGPTQPPWPAPPPLPRQLPAAPAWFTGRTTELAELSKTLTGAGGHGAPATAAISGIGGIGKTSLALHWAHEHVDQFPDGQLFVNLRGFDPSGQPMTPATAVRGFLDAFGVPPAGIPIHLDAQVGLYRSLVSGRRMLIVLDNARDTTQVSDLLPGTPTCAVIVTSRDRLPGLVGRHGADPLAVEVLDGGEARELLARNLGPERLAAEPDAVNVLLAGSGGLPLALSIVAGRAASRPDFPLAVLAAELQDTATRLDALHSDDPTASLTAMLSWSYEALTAPQAQVFGLVGLAGHPDIGLAAASALTGLPAARLSPILRVLDRQSLLQQHAPQRWRMHDLVRLYAAERANLDQPAPDRTAAIRRLVDFYLHTAHAAGRLIDPHRPPVVLDDPSPGSTPRHLPSESAALAWLDAEHRCVIAAQTLATDRGWDHIAWQLAWTLDPLHGRHAHLSDNVTIWQAGLAASERLDDPPMRALAHRRLGNALIRAGQHATGADHLDRALALAVQADDLPGQAHTHLALAQAGELQGDNERALRHATRALHLYQVAGNPAREASAQNTVGWYLARLGQYEQAHAHLEAALTLARRHNHRDAEADTLDSLGYLADRSGQHTNALRHYRQALALYRDLGNTYGETDTLDRIGVVHATLDNRDEARRAWQLALELCRNQSRTAKADRLRQRLSSLSR
jgi:DNA-binding SARP family transcriptional activator/tetratricopeptide (TPR) repeat protein